MTTGLENLLAIALTTDFSPLLLAASFAAVWYCRPRHPQHSRA